MGPHSSKQVSEDAHLAREQPAVVAPELSQDAKSPIPEVGQDAQTGPEFIGDEDPNMTSAPKKKSLLQKIFKFKK